MDACENHLLATSKIPANSGHPLHKGTPREAFIRGFLEGHLPANVAIGSGEIIDADSAPGAPRNQFDIVIYRRSYPKLDFGGGLSGFLVESVIATVEVKSTITHDELKSAVRAARTAKSLTPNVTTSFSAGWIPPNVLNYVVAYDGPASVRTVYGWLPQIHTDLSIPTPRLPDADDQRFRTPAPSIDGLFVLGKGFLYFDNVPIGFATASSRAADPDMKWIFADTATGNLLLLFALLQTAMANLEGKWLNPGPYLKSFSVPHLHYGRV